ncbi:MAG: NADH:flavin oxidoreductase [Magnetococcus sp. DMHC-1]|nr:NADH:flavin oxidoreductase [Magnetococcales bacterium]
MKHIFEKTVINGMVLKNRLVRSATWEGMCTEDGSPTDRLMTCYRDLARGGVGLIVTGYAHVRADGRQLAGAMGIHTDERIDALQRLTKAVHVEGGTIAVQLVHTGGKADTTGLNHLPWTPSGIRNDLCPEPSAAMTRDDIAALVSAFAAAARRAKASGFDAVQLHAAHGYLINQFLSPLSNQRTDDYGGSIENRQRFLMEVHAAVRQTVGPNYPVLIKLNGDDFLAGGLTLAEAMIAAEKLAAAGIDAIEVSGGTAASGKQTPVRGRAGSLAEEGYHRDLARKIKAVARCPILVVGGFRTLELLEQTLQSGDADYIALARPFIREPDLANRWQRGDRSPSTCQSCNGCFKPGLKEGGIYCVKKKEQE